MLSKVAKVVVLQLVPGHPADCVNPAIGVLERQTSHHVVPFEEVDVVDLLPRPVQLLLDLVLGQHHVVHPSPSHLQRRQAVPKSPDWAHLDGIERSKCSVLDKYVPPACTPCRLCCPGKWGRA